MTLADPSTMSIVRFSVRLDQMIDTLAVKLVDDATINRNARSSGRPSGFTKTRQLIFGSEVCDALDEMPESCGAPGSTVED